ncbi:MAG: formate dehydrogenase accessory sulfurtransferase FdhD [Thermomicrobiales bacterium]|nr:formate dehydrogenase accessory sulfurtransferase FdhD [Thermomicrobiales bacterium]MCO5223000.1 formate dehydrogenase accessory sulfurtransferase FdhD [Thermomicrobiales bacterium]
MQAIEDGRATARIDMLATEEPLEIRLKSGNRTQPVTVTMRTPGADFELAAGLLFAEGIVRHRGQLSRIEYCVECEGSAAQQYNIVTAVMAPGTVADIFVPGRTFGMTSACGLCGKERIDEIERRGIEPVRSALTVSHEVITQLPDRLRDAQGLFESTGGIHAAGLFDAAGNLLVLREDVGRHNAVDKVIGWAFLEERLPLSESMLMISGRGGFEIVQKAVAAGIPIVCAVSAPSSLAVDLARRFNQTLIGFLRGTRFNIYSSANRIELAPPEHSADSG